MKRILSLFFLFALPSAVFAQNSIFDNSESTIGSIRNLSPFASTNTDAVIYNPAGLAFSEKPSQISIGLIGGFQQIRNKPFSINNDNDTLYGFTHLSSIIRTTPSIQAYSGLGKLKISWSLANEGGGGVWYDKNGNVVLDEYYNQKVNASGMLDTVQQLLQKYLVNDEDVVRMNSVDFYSIYNNYCIRIGAIYQIAKSFSAYLGCKTNMVHYSDATGGQFFIHRPSTGERWLVSDYLLASTGLTTGVNDSLYKKIQNSARVDSRGEEKNYAISPIMGFALHHNSLNVGLKYEMTSAMFNGMKTIVLPNDLSFGIMYCLNKKLELSAGANLKWGFNFNTDSIVSEAIHAIASDKNRIKYTITLGMDYRIRNNVLLSASTAFGSGFSTLRSSGSYLEILGNIHATPARFSLGMQYQISEKSRIDIGCSINPFNSIIRVNTVSNFVNDGTIVSSHCDYWYMPRVTAGIGLTYDF